MQAGELDRKVSIIEMTTSKDAWNYDVQTESVLAEIWAKRKDLRPSEELEANQIVAITRTEWWIRYRSGINRKMLIKSGSEYFEIVGIQEFGRKEFLILTTEFREDGV